MRQLTENSTMLLFYLLPLFGIDVGSARSTGHNMAGETRMTQIEEGLGVSSMVALRFFLKGNSATPHEQCLGVLYRQVFIMKPKKCGPVSETKDNFSSMDILFDDFLVVSSKKPIHPVRFGSFYPNKFDHAQMKKLCQLILIN